MKKYLKITLLSGILAAGGAVVSVAAENIKIGFNVPLTGFAAADGQSALHGAELAVKQVNGSGGVNGSMLELVVYDDQACPKESAPLAVKMITKDGYAYFYDHAIVALPQPDGTHFITRMD